MKEKLAELVTLRVLKEVLLSSVRTFNKNGRMWHLVFILRCTNSHDTVNVQTVTHIWGWWSDFMLMKVTQLCPALCHFMDCSPTGSSFHGILQARILERIVIPFSRESFLDPAIEPRSPALQADSLPSEPPGKPLNKKNLPPKPSLWLLTSS